MHIASRVVFFTNLFSCNTCPEPQGVCAVKVPQNEQCMAYFQRWFFNPATNSCTQIGYSGCSTKGFETKQACEACKCND